ncbi:hypothetical protein T492DRAFT_1017541, partial [Pavlovales sp. CCMP2436]
VWGVRVGVSWVTVATAWSGPGAPPCASPSPLSVSGGASTSGVGCGGMNASVSRSASLPDDAGGALMSERGSAMRLESCGASSESCGESLLEGGEGGSMGEGGAAVVLACV